eukprot:1136179-Rhodomonas_salina.1
MVIAAPYHGTRVSEHCHRKARPRRNHLHPTLKMRLPEEGNFHSQTLHWPVVSQPELPARVLSPHSHCRTGCPLLLGFFLPLFFGFALLLFWRVAEQDCVSRPIYDLGNRNSPGRRFGHTPLCSRRALDLLVLPIAVASANLNGDRDGRCELPTELRCGHDLLGG